MKEMVTMSLQYKDLDAITEADLNSLKDNKIEESLELDYKQAFPKLAEQKDKNEFLKDICAFANTAGGDIIFGIQGKDYPTNILGIDFSVLGKLDDILLQISQIIDAQFEPRLPLGIAPKAIPLTNGNSVLIIRVPKSWAGPHRVKTTNKFYARRFTKNYEMDIDEIRASFVLSENLQNKIRNFRFERLAMLQLGRSLVPTPLANGPKLVIHVIPIQAFNKTAYGTFPRKGISAFETLMSSAKHHDVKRNFNGMCRIIPHPDPNVSSWPISYCQVYNNGILEMVDAFILDRGATCSGRTSSRNYVYPEYETQVVKILFHNIQGLIQQGFSPPFFIFTSLLGIQDFDIAVPNNGTEEIFRAYKMGNAIREKELLLQEIEILNTPENPYDLAGLLKPAFDGVWHAVGREGSNNYAEDGTFIPDLMP